jgi:hypothetical protein
MTPNFEIRFRIELDVPPIEMTPDLRDRLGQLKRNARNRALTDVDGRLVAEVVTHLEAIQAAVKRNRATDDGGGGGGD